MSKTKDQIQRTIKRVAAFEARVSESAPHPRQLPVPLIQVPRFYVKHVSVITYDEPAVGLITPHPCRLPGLAVENGKNLATIICSALLDQAGIDAAIQTMTDKGTELLLRPLWFNHDKGELVYWYDCQPETRNHHRKSFPDFKFFSPEALPLDGRMEPSAHDYLAIFYAYCRIGGVILPDWPRKYIDDADRVKPQVRKLLSESARLTPYAKSRL
jgi:hypothetical protein